MTTSSVPAGSAVSACHTIAGSAPDTSRSVRAMSRSRLMPGKTTTADFMAPVTPAPPRRSSRRPVPQHLNAVVLDHRVGEELVGGILERRLDPRPVGALDLDVEHLAL